MYFFAAPNSHIDAIAPVTPLCVLTLNQHKNCMPKWILATNLVHITPIHFWGNLTHASFFKKINEYLNFSNHIKEKISKANKGIGILRKFYNFLPRNSGRNSLITIYKSFIQPHLDLVPSFSIYQKMGVFVKINQISSI